MNCAAKDCQKQFSVEGRYGRTPRFCSAECRNADYRGRRPAKPSRATVHSLTGPLTPAQRACRIANGLRTW